MNYMIRKKATIFIFFISLILLFIGVFTDDFFLTIMGIPAFVFITLLFHELGHGMGCLINGNKIVSILVTPFAFHKSGLSFEPNQKILSYCSFIKTENDAIVYILGPIVSLIFTMVMIVLYLFSKKTSAGVLTVIAAVVFFSNCISIRTNDILHFVKEIRKEVSKA